MQQHVRYAADDNSLVVWLSVNAHASYGTGRGKKPAQEGINLGSPSASGGRLVNRFFERTLNGRAGAAEFLGDLALTLAAFGQQLDRRAFHLP